MRSKEEYYEWTLNNRRIAKDEENLKCPCLKTLCEWHGKCQECVALHRYHNNHLPNCLQPLINDKIKALATAGELEVSPKKQTPQEHRMYVKERDEETDYFNQKIE